VHEELELQMQVEEV